MGRLLRAALLASVIAGAWSCTAFEPEVGDPLAACVDADSDPAKPVDFKAQIRPIFAAHCSKCHYHDRGTQEGYLTVHFNLEELGYLRMGGVNTRDDIVVPGKPCASALVQKIRGTFPIGARMPKNGPPYLSNEDTQLIMDWIAEGAKGDDED